jgi:hypothetical protein
MSDTIISKLDVNVIKGFRGKSKSSEAVLSKWVPFVNCYLLLKNSKIDTYQNSDSQIYDVRLNKNTYKAIEIAKLESQTSTKLRFRGGCGINSLSVSYKTVDIGALEAKLQVYFSNIQQININPELKSLLQPGHEFLIFYGWNSDDKNWNSENLLKDKINTIDLNEFNNGMKAVLYCTLHHFDWEFLEMGRVMGTLYFFSPDVVRAQIYRVDYNSQELLQTLVLDTNESDIEKNLTNYTKNKISDELNRLKKDPNILYPEDIKRKFKDIKTGIYSIDLVPECTIKGIRTKQITNSGVTYLKYDYYFLGYILESACLVLRRNLNEAQAQNTLLYTITINYENFAAQAQQDTLIFLEGFKEYQGVLPFNNVFFVPINSDILETHLKNFKGNLRSFLDSVVKLANDNSRLKDPNVSLFITRKSQNVYVVGDFINELTKSQNKEIETKENVTTYKVNPDDSSDPSMLVEYGSTGSLVYNFKLTSTIAPDILWTQGYSFDSEQALNAVKGMLLGTNLTDAEKYAMRIQTERVFFAKIRKLQKNEKITDTELRKQYQENADVFFANPQVRKAAVNAVEEMVRIGLSINDNTRSMIVQYANFDPMKINVGTVLRNYFNGITLTLHGTTGFKAFKTFFFKGLELGSNDTGIDGCYVVQDVNDTVNASGFETVIEARRASTGKIIWTG